MNEYEVTYSVKLNSNTYEERFDVVFADSQEEAIMKVQNNCIGFLEDCYDWEAEEA